MTEVPMEEIMADLQGCTGIVVEFKLPTSDWSAQFDYVGRCFGGRGNTPDEALIEAMTDKEIAECGDEVPQAKMEEILQQNYRYHLGVAPPHGYRGVYAETATLSKNPRQAANEAILALIEDAVQNQPDSRFWQILMNLRVLDYRMEDGVFYCRDPWSEESAATLRRMRGAESYEEG